MSLQPQAHMWRLWTGRPRLRDAQMHGFAPLLPSPPRSGAGASEFPRPGPAPPRRPGAVGGWVGEAEPGLGGAPSSSSRAPAARGSPELPGGNAGPAARAAWEGVLARGGRGGAGRRGSEGRGARRQPGDERPAGARSRGGEPGPGRGEAAPASRGEPAPDVRSFPQSQQQAPRLRRRRRPGASAAAPGGRKEGAGRRLPGPRGEARGGRSPGSPGPARSARSLRPAAGQHSPAPRPPASAGLLLVMN